MSTAIRTYRELHPSYLALVRRFPLRAIKREAEYTAAGDILDQLVLRSDLNRGERDYLSALELLIEAYDDSEFSELADDRPPHKRLRALLESSGTTAAELQNILGLSQSLISLMLSGQRALSKKTISKLAHHFQVEPGFFI